MDLVTGALGSVIPKLALLLKEELLDPEQLIKELREFLQDKRYLIVIDDIWKIETWKRINYALVENNNGSIIIITTRHSDVADEADVNYKLEPLPRGQSEKLFYTRIFGTNGTCPNNQLKEWAKHRDNGLKLENLSFVKKVTSNVFPEDYVIDKERLIWKWIAEGFIHEEEPGTRYLGLKGTETCKLPEGVGALKLLQTLDFDLAFNKEKEDAPDKLPSSLGLLTDLICLRAGLAMVPNGVIKKLTSLEELQMSTSYDDTQSNASYYTSRHFVEDLGNLCELRVLIADFWVGEGEEECTELDLVKSLSNLKKIQHLELDCQILIKYQALWNTVVLPQSLRSLVARHIYFSALPSWINSSALPNLISLDLTVRNMDEQGLKILGRLPMLRHLKLNIPSVWLQEGPKITIDAAEAFFQKLRSLSVPCSTVWFVLNDNSSVSFTLFKNTDVDFGSKNRKRDECRVALPTILPDLQLLCFEIKMQETLIRNKLSCANLGLKYLHSLQKVKVTFLCEDGAFADEAYKQKAALRHAVYSHPNRPTLEFVH
ncbi:hypothetical protein QOZ80_9AG0692040 [Eleusine coracana subsp. coracana]|nr:hypothetical protein QOZ80_9AG0692040 [Eleusine coracana subsp. coracana]